MRIKTAIEERWPTVACNRVRIAVLGALGATLLSAVALTGSVAAAQLPDARAYEMVSPPGKNGAEVLQQTTKTHVATDGDGVTFSALSGFGTVQGTSLDAEYLSRRTGMSGTNGWTTQGINPLGASDTLLAIVLGNNNTYVNAFTPDLSAAIYRSWRPLVDAPNVADVSNLYRISGLGGRGATAQLMTDSVTPVPPLPPLFKLLMRPPFVGASTDLSHVVFESRIQLTNDDPPQAVFTTRLYENADGVVRLAGRIPVAPDTTCDDVNGPDCVAADTSQAGISATLKQYSARMVSDDGRRILFQVPAGADSGTIYMREDGVRTVQIAQNGQLWSASVDGSRIFFTTSDSLLPEDTDSNPDLYMYEPDAPASAQLTLVSASSVNAGTVETVVGASDDGRYVYFACDGQLVSGEPSADLSGLYVWHDRELAYIGKLVDLGEAMNNSPRTGYDFVSGMSGARVSPDGRNLLFMTHDDAGLRGRGGFPGYDHAGHHEVYLYSFDTRRLACASCNPGARAATVDALINVRDGAGNSEVTSKLSHALSDDGHWVFFTTAEALLPEDTNGTLDAYEYDAHSGALHLISSGTDPAPSYFIDASNDGANVFFVTRQRLLGWDVDDSYDLYDARVHGGFPEPAPPAAQCTGEACLGQGTPAPAADSIATSGVRGAGNVAGRLRKPRRCGHGKVLRHVRGKTRCVRRKSSRRCKVGGCRRSSHRKNRRR
jgi:hypothetical protein